MYAKKARATNECLWLMVIEKKLLALSRNA